MTFVTPFRGFSERVVFLLLLLRIFVSLSLCCNVLLIKFEEHLAKTLHKHKMLLMHLYQRRFFIFNFYVIWELRLLFGI